MLKFKTKLKKTLMRHFYDLKIISRVVCALKKLSVRYDSGVVV